MRFCKYPLNKEYIENLFYNEKKSRKEIAELLNIPLTSFRYSCKAQGIYLEPRKFLPTDLTNQRFDKLVALEFVKKARFGGAVWLCQCDCGRKKNINSSSLFGRLSKTCGCSNRFKNLFAFGGIYQSYWRSLIKNSEFRNLEFTISPEYAWQIYNNQNGKCIFTGIELIFCVGGKRKNGQNASLDRIDSSKGYIEGNIQWIHKDINKMKQNFSDEYFLEMCNKVVNYKGKANGISSYCQPIQEASIS